MIYGAKKDDSFFARELEVVWMQEINDPESTLACRVQAQLKCQGFEEADCQRGSRTQNFSRCATNCRPEDEKSKPQFENVIFAGCRDRISSFYIKWNAVLVAGAGAATILCFVAWFVTCCSVSFEKEV